MNTIEAYKVFSKFYDMYVKDFDIDLPLYNYFCDRNHNIVEVGCGTGRVLKSLAEQGCNVLGIDISDEMLDIAEEKLMKFIINGTIRLKKHNFVESSIAENFDRVLITFYTLNYLIDKKSCNIFLENVYKSMNDKGIMLLDLFYPKPLCYPEASDIWNESIYCMDGIKIIVKDKRKMEGNMENRIQEYIVKEKRYKIETQRKFYTKKEVLEMLEVCGFVNIEFADSYNFNQLHPLKDVEETISSYIVKAEK